MICLMKVQSVFAAKNRENEEIDLKIQLKRIRNVISFYWAFYLRHNSNGPKSIVSVHSSGSVEKRYTRIRYSPNSLCVCDN